MPPLVHWSDFLLPAWVPGVLCLIAAVLKYLEYRRQEHRLDFLMIVAILARLGLGATYLLLSDSVLSDRIAFARFFITLMILVEIFRSIRRRLAWNQLLRILGQNGQNGEPR